VRAVLFVAFCVGDLVGGVGVCLFIYVCVCVWFALFVCLVFFHCVDTGRVCV
jgi:hypothetical protein